jgi:hypothetical protein
MGCCFSAVFPITQNTASYEYACRILQTGDLVYFCNFASVTSYFTIAATGYAVSHMGMIVKMKDNVLGVLESVRHDDSMCDMFGKVHCGVRIVGFREKLLLHGSLASTPVYVQVLSVTPERRLFMESALKRFVREVDCAPYQKDLVCMCLAPLRSLIAPAAAAPGVAKSYYCSELIAAAYKAMGLLPGTLRAEDVWPTHFFQNQLTLLNGAYLDTEGFYCKTPRTTTTTTPRQRRPPPLEPELHTTTTERPVTEDDETRLKVVVLKQ